MRALALLTLVLAGCGKAPAPTVPNVPQTIDEAKSAFELQPTVDKSVALKNLTDAHAELTAEMQTELTRLDTLMADWKATITASLADAEDDAQRAELTKQDEEFRATDARLRQELSATYDPILADLESRMLDAAASLKLETDRFQGK